jgi:WD40 repeat protein
VIGDDLSLQHTLHRDQEEDTIQSVAFSPSGLTLATGLGNNQVYLFNVSSGELIDTLRVGDPKEYVIAVAFSPDNSMLAVGSSDGTVQVWRFLGEGEPKSRPEWSWASTPTSKVLSVTFSPQDSTILASGFEDGYVRIWNAVEGRIRHLTQIQASIKSIAFSPDGTILAVATKQGIVYLLDGSNLNDLRKPLELAGDARAIAFSPDGTLLGITSPEGVSLWGIGP